MSYRDDEGHGTDTANDSTKVVAGRSKRKLVDGSPRYHPASNHLSLDFRYTKRARYQHISNLVTCMRHFEATGEDDKLALVLATMLLAENPDSINLHWQFRSKHAHSRLSEVLLSAYRLLLRHPEAGSVELQAKLLKRASPYQVTPEGSLAVQLELGRLLYAHKNARADAYDLLVSLSKIPDSEVGKLLETERLALLARIRIDQLEDTMAHVAQGRGGNSLMSGQGYSQHLWSAGGRAVRQLYDEAQSFLGTTIKLQPHRMDNIVLRMALFWSKGQKEAARELADTFLPVNKDKDAVAIRVALCIESFVADKDEANVEQLYKLLKLSSDLLQIDPQCLASLKVLMYAGRRLAMTDFPWTADGSRAIKLMLHGLSNYVEASSPPNDEFHRALYFEAWKLLRTLLVMIFNRFCQCHREYYCQQKNSRESDMLMSKEVKEQWEARNKLNQGFRMFQVASSVLKGMAMNGFDFDALLPRTVVEMKKWVADGTVPDLNCIFSILVIRYASQLAVLADSRRKLNAQRLGGVDVQALFPMVHCSGIAEKLNVFRCLEWLKSELEQSVEQAAVMKEIKDHVLVIKESYGRVQHSYDQALYELGVLVSLTRNRDVDRPWTPYGIDAVHPELGAFSSPPGTWWKVFPQVRRQRRKECLEEEECQEPQNAFRVSHPDSTHKDSKLKRVRFQD